MAYKRARSGRFKALRPWRSLTAATGSRHGAQPKAAVGKELVKDLELTGGSQVSAGLLQAGPGAAANVAAHEDVSHKQAVGRLTETHNSNPPTQTRTGFCGNRTGYRF